MGNVKIDNKKYLGMVLDDITANNLRITQYIGDNPKRSFAKGCKCHSSWYACEYCYAKGCKIDISNSGTVKTRLSNQKQAIEEKIRECESDPNSPGKKTKLESLITLKDNLQLSLNSLKRKSNILWPSSTMNCEHRSRSSILEIVQKIENKEKLSIDEAKGIMERSLLLDIPNFNFVYDSPAEYLHCGCLGVVKRMVELTFNIGDNRPRITKRKLSSVTKFNALMCQTKVPKETSRRARKLDFSVFKGQEFRNIAIFFFPLVLECIEPGEKERNAWLYLAYVLRAALIPSNEFAHIDLEIVNTMCANFYHLYESLFGKQNCPYNLHVFCSHLLEIRTHGPLTETSAFKFEAFYGELRRAFVPGTVSPLKQILKNIMLKRALRKHFCQNTIFLSNYDTPLESNNLIYTYNRNVYEIYQISDINGNVMNCMKVGLYPVHFPETPNLDWSSVGMFKKGGVCSKQIQLLTSEVHGKVFHVDKYLLTCPINVLNEK